MNTETAKKTADKLKTANEASNSMPQKPLQPAKIKEIGGYDGPEPTRYGDWEIGGRCSDF